MCRVQCTLFTNNRTQQYKVQIAYIRNYLKADRSSRSRFVCRCVCEMRIKRLFILFHFIFLICHVLSHMRLNSHKLRKPLPPPSPLPPQLSPPHHHHANVMKIVIALVVCRCYFHTFSSHSSLSISAAVGLCVHFAAGSHSWEN